MQNYILVAAGVGFFISRHFQNLLFRFLSRRLGAIYQITSETLTENGTYFGMFARTVVGVAGSFANVTLCFIFVTSLRNPVNLLLGPIATNIVVGSALIFSAMLSKSFFGWLINYKQVVG